MPYLPGLDGMRALAVVAVMVWHANHEWLGGGFLGVEIFFVISGYLITLLLIAEHERTGLVSLRGFWGRRLRRLLPALYLTLVGVSIYCALFLRDPLGKLRGDVFAAIFYVSNWFQIWSGHGYTDGSDFVPLRHLWSLAVEEQFYLIWPLVMLVLLRRGRQRLPQVGVWLIGLSLLITIATAVFFHTSFYTSNAGEYPSAFFGAFGRKLDTNNFLYLSTFSRSSGIMLGAGFAMLWRPLAVMRGPLRDKGRTLDLVAVLGLLGLIGVVFYFELIGSSSGVYYAPLFRGGFLLTGLSTLAIIAAVTHAGSVMGRLLGNPVLNWIGTRSYGLYLVHWPIYQVIRRAAAIPLTVPKFILAMVCTVIITELSYRLLETPVRKRQFLAKLDATRPRILAGLAVAGLLAGFAGVSLVTASVKCSNKLECDLQAAATVVGPITTAAGPASSTTTGVTVAPTAVSVPGATTPTAVVVPTVAPPTTLQPTIELLALGESVMKGAEGKLKDQGFTVNAIESQGPNKLSELLAQYVAGNTISTLVIQIGTNGPVTQAQYDKILNEAKDVANVFVLTVKAPKGWIDANNQVIRGLPATHPNVQVIDWEQEAQKIIGELSKSDGGVHLDSATAVKFYTNMILAAAGRPTIP